MKRRVSPTMIGVGILLAFLAGLWVFYPVASIEEGVPYSLGYTYLADLEVGDGQLERARVFDFSDRNLPEKSIIVPLVDANGIPLVRRNADLPINTVQKVRIQVPGRTVEGVAYPAYEFVRWEFNPSTTETQSIVPVIKPQS
ncbi:MAG: hypothetical protein Q8R55_04305 [Candidatus Taylorbacteria bacterium]|nr:hypothetical protein [Candidatus Taylorbacteria bacterium]